MKAGTVIQIIFIIGIVFAFAQLTIVQNYYFENSGGVIFRYNANSGHVDYCYISENKWERLGHE